MDKKGNPSQIRKHSKKVKRTMKGLHVDQPLEIHGSLELTEQNAVSEMGEDCEVQEEVAEVPHQQKKPSKNTSCGSRSYDKRNIPKTFITAVLEELNDDIIEEPTMPDTGK
jgi:hypothetical protein